MIKKILFLIPILLYFSCQKNEDNKSVLFLKGIDDVKLYSYPSRTMWDTVNYGKEKIVFKKGKLTFDKTKVVDSIVLSKKVKDKIISILIDSKWENKG